MRAASSRGLERRPALREGVPDRAAGRDRADAPLLDALRARRRHGADAHARHLPGHHRAQEAESERERVEELREADRRKDEFLAMLSHELRNPLAPILNAVEILDRTAPDDEEQIDGTAPSSSGRCST